MSNVCTKRVKHPGAVGALLGCVALAGCTVGPDYQKPAEKAPAGWAATQPAPGAAVTLTGEPAQLIRWWETFNDPTLTSLVERAIASNLDVKLARARLWQSRASRGIAEGGLWPSVNAGGGYTRSGPATGAQSNRFRAGVDAAWELDVFGGQRRGIESADADIAAAAEDERGVLVSLAAEVALNYIDLRAQQARLAIAKKSLETQRKGVQLTRQRQSAGFATALDVSNAEGDVASTEASLPTLESAIQQTAYSLSLLLALEPGALDRELKDSDPGIPPLPGEVPVGLPSDLLRRRPDIRRAEAQIKSANAQIGAAVADLFPKFTLSGNVGFEANRLNSLSNWGSRTWSLGPSVTWQIFDAGRIQSNIQVKKAQTEQALLSYHKAVLTAFSETDKAIDALSSEQKRTSPLHDAMESSRTSLSLSTRLYTSGQSDFLNVLTAQRSLYSAEDATVQNRRNIAANLVALYKALGGGWEGWDQPGVKR